jgi:hypothetical protein
MRRVTSLTMPFSKKIENDEESVAFRIKHYNFHWVRKTLHATPAIEPRLSEQIHEID